jgi:hypothetical protein
MSRVNTVLSKLFILGIFFLVFSCSKNEKSSFKIFWSSATSSTIGSLTLTVAPTYSTASNWASFVRRSDLVTPCDGTETGFSPCMHGGDKKKVVLTGITSCSGLTMTDFLGAFHWRCEVTTGTATFYSYLKLDKKLADLLTSLGWSANYVTLSNGAASVSSSSLVWWTNPVIEATDNSSFCTADANHTCDATQRARLITANAVYMVSSGRVTLGYKIAANGISFTTLNNVTLGGKNNLAHNGSWANDDDVGPYEIFVILTTYNVRNIWVEGRMQNYSVDPIGSGFTTDPINIRNTNQSIFRHIYVATSNDDCVNVQNSKYNNFSMIKTSNCGWGVWIGDSLGGISSYNVFSAVISDSHFGEGIYLVKAPFNHIVASSASHNSNAGLYLTKNSDSVIIHNYFGSFNGNYGVHTEGGSGTPAHIDDMTYGQMAITNNGNKGVRFNDNNISKVTGTFVTKSNFFGDCESTAGTDPLSNACALQALSDTTQVTPASVISLVGQVLSDLTNVSEDAFGKMTISITNDWTNFINSMRSWGRTGLTPVFGDAGTIGACRNTDVPATCQMYDMRPLSGDIVIRNNTNDGLSNGAAFAVNQNCPAAVNGNTILTNTTGSLTYLKNAIEIDGKGNGNGLCESNETCLYTPNFGAYQGYGTYGECNYTDGTISGVVMSGFESNGI